MRSLSDTARFSGNPCPQPGRVYVTKSTSFDADPGRILDAAHLDEAAEGVECVLIKPNLVEAVPPPVTTPVDLVARLVDYLQGVTSAEIIIAEGTGALHYDTWWPFEKLGYMALAEEKGVKLVDLNTETCRKISMPSCRRWPAMFLPEIALDSFIISVPVLKVHTLADVTLTMKNMMGLAPPEHYRQGQSWKKSAFHKGIQEAVADLNRYRSPDFTLLDASVGMAEAHLYGAYCDPPVGIVAAGYDPVAMDAYGATLLEKDWRDIGHIAGVDGELGQASLLDTVLI